MHKRKRKQTCKLIISSLHSMKQIGNENENVRFSAQMNIFRDNIELTDFTSDRYDKVWRSIKLNLVCRE